MKTIFKTQSNEERREMILNGKVINTLLFLSIPTLLVGIIQALIPLSDSLFLNRLTSVEVASSVTFSQPVLNIMIALSQGLGVATLVMLGRLYGKGRMLAGNDAADFCFQLCYWTFYNSSLYIFSLYNFQIYNH